MAIGDELDRAGNATHIGHTKDVPVGCARVFRVEDRAVAVFNVDGKFFALDNTCPHRGASLGEGQLEGCLVRCPWHGWQFDVTTGQHPTKRSRQAIRYEIRTDGENLLVVF